MWTSPLSKYRIWSLHTAASFAQSDWKFFWRNAFQLVVAYRQRKKVNCFGSIDFHIVTHTHSIKLSSLSFNSYLPLGRRQVFLKRTPKYNELMVQDVLYFLNRRNGLPAKLNNTLWVFKFPLWFTKDLIEIPIALEKMPKNHHFPRDILTGRYSRGNPKLNSWPSWNNQILISNKSTVKTFVNVFHKQLILYFPN